MSLAAIQKIPEPKARAVHAKAGTASVATGLATPMDISLIQRKSSCACGGSCPSCRAKNEFIQSKLKISAPNDKYEQEADRVANQIMRMPTDDSIFSSEKTLPRVTQTYQHVARAPIDLNLKRKALEGTAPRWHEVPGYVQDDLRKKGYGKNAYNKTSEKGRQTILNLYVKLKGLGLWRLVESNANTGSETSLEFNAKHYELRETLTILSDFTEPDVSLKQWSSREKKTRAALHFKHFAGWPEKQVQAHIDPVGIFGSSVPILGVLFQSIKHLFDYEGYQDSFRIRSMLLTEGWDRLALLGITENSLLMRKATHTGSDLQNPGSVPSLYPASAGQPLPVTLRNFYEPHFGRDLTGVRIHTDTNAAHAAQSIDARAYTLGNNVVFNSGEFSPHTDEGKRLLAHELTHVIQQQGQRLPTSVQRTPVFPDDTCDKGNVKKKIIRHTGTALELVRNAVTALDNPETVSGPLNRIFHIDLAEPGHREVLLDIVVQHFSQMQALLEGPINNYCDKCNYRAHAVIGKPEKGITICSNIFNFFSMTTSRQIVNTIIHEYAHMAGVGHGVEGKSIKVRGLTELQALNNAESYMRFIRAVN